MARKKNTNPTMTASQLKKLRVNHFRVTQVVMAKMLGIVPRTYIAYEQGTPTIPEPIALLVRCLKEKS